MTHIGKSENQTQQRVIRLFMDDLLPEWRQLRRLLNQLPLRHADWEY